MKGTKGLYDMPASPIALDNLPPSVLLPGKKPSFAYTRKRILRHWQMYIYLLLPLAYIIIFKSVRRSSDGRRQYLATDMAY